MNNNPEVLKFGNFEILRKENGDLWELGRGGFGTTYKAENKHLMRLSALKVINDDRVASEESRKRFIHEARAAASLQHPNIAAVFDFGEHDGTYYYAMEFCGEGDLEEYAQSKGPLPWEIVRSIANQVVSGLACAHNNGLLHRDLKPSNIMLINQSGDVPEVKLIDFGLVKVLDHVKTSSTQVMMTQEGAAGFNPLTASPEQLREEELDERSDLFSLGVTFLYLLRGGIPFGDVSAVQMMADRLNDTSYDELLPKDLPEDGRQIMSKLLEKNRDHRFQSASELIDALRSNSAAVSQNQASTTEQAPSPAAEATQTEAEETTTDWSALWEVSGLWQKCDSGSYYHTQANTTDAPAVIVFSPRSTPPLPDSAIANMDALVGTQSCGNLVPFLKSGTMDGDATYLCPAPSQPQGSLLDLIQAHREFSLQSHLVLFQQMATAIDIAADKGLAGVELDYSSIRIDNDLEATSNTSDWTSHYRQCLKDDPQFAAKQRLLFFPKFESNDGQADVQVTLKGDDLAASPIATFGSMCYRLISGMSVKSAAYLSPSAYVATSSLGEEANSFLADVICAQAELDTAEEVLTQLCEFEGVSIDSDQISTIHQLLETRQATTLQAISHIKASTPGSATPKPASEPKTDPSPAPAPGPTPKAKPEPDPKPEAKPEPKTEPKRETRPEPKPESKPEPKPEPKSRPVDTPETKNGSKRGLIIAAAAVLIIGGIIAATQFKPGSDTPGGNNSDNNNNGAITSGTNNNNQQNGNTPPVPETTHADLTLPVSTTLPKGITFNLRVKNGEQLATSQPYQPNQSKLTFKGLEIKTIKAATELEITPVAPYRSTAGTATSYFSSDFKLDDNKVLTSQSPLNMKVIGEFSIPVKVEYNNKPLKAGYQAKILNQFASSWKNKPADLSLTVIDGNQLKFTTKAGATLDDKVNMKIGLPGFKEMVVDIDRNSSTTTTLQLAVATYEVNLTDLIKKLPRFNHIEYTPKTSAKPNASNELLTLLLGSLSLRPTKIKYTDIKSGNQSTVSIPVSMSGDIKVSGGSFTDTGLLFKDAIQPGSKAVKVPAFPKAFFLAYHGKLPITAGGRPTTALGIVSADFSPDAELVVSLSFTQGNWAGKSRTQVEWKFTTYPTTMIVHGYRNSSWIIKNTTDKFVKINGKTPLNLEWIISPARGGISVNHKEKDGSNNLTAKMNLVRGGDNIQNFMTTRFIEFYKAMPPGYKNRNQQNGPVIIELDQADMRRVLQKQDAEQTLITDVPSGS